MSLDTITETVPAVLRVLPAAVNLVLIAIVIICAWQGFKKGIIMGIIGVLVIILSLYGAQLLSDTFSYEVIPVLKPFVSGYAETQVEKTAFEAFGYEADINGEYHVARSLTDLIAEQPDSRYEISRRVFQKLGIYSDVAESMARKTVAFSDQNNADLSSSVVTILCQSITWYGGFLIAFILLYAAMTVLVNILNLSFRLPYVGIINDLGGLGIGIFTGLLICAVIVWAIQFTGLVMPESVMGETGVIGWFLDRNMLANYITF